MWLLGYLRKNKHYAIAPQYCVIRTLRILLFMLESYEKHKMHCIAKYRVSDVTVGSTHENHCVVMFAVAPKCLTAQFHMTAMKTILMLENINYMLGISLRRDFHIGLQGHL